MYTCNGKTEVVSFVVKSGRKLTIGVKFEVNDNRNKISFNVIIIDYYMAFSISHAISTLGPSG
jgi:hypothetical protein